MARRETIGELGIADLKTSRAFFFKTDEALVQGQLYRRILGHIHDPDIRKIAHPGLALRRIDPELIREVLAEPCGIEVPDDQRSQELFRELRREASLVDLEPDGAVRHRPDVRHVMLRLLESDKPEEVEAIERRAVAYYSSRTGPVARAEEIYHRLRLGDDPWQIDSSKWEKGVALLLEGSIDELPKRAQAHLATHLDLRVKDELRKLADLEDWERLTAQRARELLHSGAAERALEILRQRQERTAGGPLWRLEAEVLNKLDRREEAAEIVAKGIVLAGQSGEYEAKLELLVPAARIALRDGNAGAADGNLAEAENLADQLGHDVSRFLILLMRAELHTNESDDPETAEMVRQRLRELFLALPANKLVGRPDSIRKVVRLMGVESPKVIARAADLLPIDWERSDGTDEVANQLARLYSSSRPLARWLKRFVSRGRSPKHPEVAKELLFELAAQHRIVELVERLAVLQEMAKPSLEALVQVIAGDDAPSEGEDLCPSPTSTTTT